MHALPPTPGYQSVYIVDGSETYRQLLQQAFDQFLPHYQPQFFTSGKPFVDKLPTLSKPGLLLLDNALLDIDRCEVVQQVRAHADWKFTPIVILSDSDEAEDIASCYGAGANSFVVKPTQLNAVRQMLQSLCYYWFELNQPTN